MIYYQVRAIYSTADISASDLSQLPVPGASNRDFPGFPGPLAHIPRDFLIVVIEGRLPFDRRSCFERSVFPVDPFVGIGICRHIDF